MALDRADHKRIALNIASELQRVLSDANGRRVLARRKARSQPKLAPANPADTDRDDDVIESMSAEG